MPLRCCTNPTPVRFVPVPRVAVFWCLPDGSGKIDAMFCNLCDARATSNFRFEGYEFFECTSLDCSHVFVYPAPSREELSEFYGTLKPAMANSDGMTLFEDYKARPRVIVDYYRKRRLRFLQSHSRVIENREARILDVGCSTGMFLRVLRDLGFRNVAGLDLSSQMCKFVRSAHGVPCFESLEEIRGEQFELITCCGVLEHTLDPRRFVEELSEKLVPGGELLICVPNFRSVYAKVTRRSWPWLIPPAHLQYFSKWGLEKLIAGKHRIIVSDTCYQNTYSYLLAHHLTRALGRPMPSTSRTGSWPTRASIYLAETALQLMLVPLDLGARIANTHLELRNLSRKPSGAELAGAR
jgi:2-polyprenyl-3-methyl-5-hydroxy-6-metoxy-1,4-benzoquinol methylase